MDCSAATLKRLSVDKALESGGFSTETSLLVEEINSPR